MHGFAGKCFILIFILCIGIVFGFQTANNGLLKVKGNTEPMIEIKNEQTSTVLRENTFKREDKEKQLEDLKSFNLFSKMGWAFANSVEVITRATSNVVIKKIEDIFQSLHS